MVGLRNKKVEGLVPWASRLQDLGKSRNSWSALLCSGFLERDGEPEKEVEGGITTTSPSIDGFSAAM